MSALSDEERIDWLRLARTDTVGPRTFEGLLTRFGSASRALDELPALLRKTGRSRARIMTRPEAEREIEALSRLGGRFVARPDGDFPRALAVTDGAPPIMAVLGAPAILARPAVALVGSRNASALGGAFAERLAGELGRSGLVVVSGLARGIDTRAHRGAVATGTVAVLAGGLDRIYPSENRPLLERILGEGGAAISEVALEHEPRGRDFPRRNRLVSGLSYGVVVVEAALRSGSLITARFGLEQGREIFAVPGSPLDPRAAGCIDLLRSGATLCAAAEHVTSVLEPLIAKGPPPATPRDGLPGLGEPVAWDAFGPDDDGGEGEGAGPLHGSDADAVAAALAPAPVSIDALSRQVDIPVWRIRAALVELELAGRAVSHADGSVSRS